MRKVTLFFININILYSYSMRPYFISSPLVSYCLRLPTGGSERVMRTIAVRDMLRSTAASKASMCFGRKRWQMAWSASRFSVSSVTISALPNAMTDLNSKVKLPSFGPTVGLHLLTALRHTQGFACIMSSFFPSIAQ